MDDDSRRGKEYPISTAKLSKTPSWIMLGFLLGAVFVAALPPLRRRPAPEAVTFRTAEPARTAAPRTPPQLTTIEAVFAVWGRFAVWSEDTTEVALWNSEEKAFSDLYEVRRHGDAFFFRTIPKLTRRIISRGKPMPECPLQFTETEEQYREWQKYGRSERPADRAGDVRPNFTPPNLPAPERRTIDITAPALPPPRLEPELPGMKDAGSAAGKSPAGK